MSTIGERLREERQRLDMNQTELGERGGVQKRAQINYEAGDRFPDASYLAAIATAGADVRYIITGSRDSPPSEALSPDERELLALFRSASLVGKAAAIGALQGATGRSGRIGQQINGPISGGVAGRDFVQGRKKKNETGDQR